MRHLTLEQVSEAHEQLLKKYGGSAGIRDHRLLESAIRRPHTTVFGKSAYPSVFDKAAAICHALLFNHPFVDGNKRAAFAACHLTLRLNGWDLTVESKEIYVFLIKTIENHLDWKEISAWIKKNSRRAET